MKTENKNNNKVVGTNSYNVSSGKHSRLTKNRVVMFLCAVILVAAVSVTVMLKENDFSFRNVKASLNPNAETTTEETTRPQALSGKVNLLLSCSDSQTGALRFAAILNTDLNTLSMKLALIPIDTYVTAEGFSGTVEEQYSHGGMEQLVLAVEEITGVSIERYLKSDDKSFLEAMKLFDNIKFNVPEESVCVMNGISYTIEPGLQELTADTVQKYLIYLCQREYGLVLNDLLCGIINSTLTVGNTFRSESIFKKLSNLFDTDISAIDYAKYSDKLNAFITDENRVPACPAENLEGF